MSVELQELVHFHRIGRRTGGELDGATPPGICSALLAPYRQLTKLRYDYPLVLIGDGTNTFAVSLSSVTDGVLQEIAPQGIAGARLRAHVLRLEAKIRELVAGGADGSFSEVWTRAEQALLAAAGDGDAELLRDSLNCARNALRIDGQIIDCDERTPARLLEHAWTIFEAQHSRTALDRIRTLILNLGDILKVDDLKAAGSRTPQNLKNSLGERYQDAFDFELMSRLLNKATPQSMLPAGRRRRIQSALSVLEVQKFFTPTTGSEKRLKNKAQYRFIFSSVANALKAYNERLPEMAEFVKAMTVAELEIGNQYRELQHDAFLECFDAQALGPADLQLFPSYLVCIDANDCSAQAQKELLEVLASDLPMKILVRISDVLDTVPVNGLQAGGSVHRGMHGQQLANMVVGLGDAYVLQSTSSNLYQLRDEIWTGLTYQGPSLFSIFSGSSAHTPDLPLYLSAASAMESRAFPAFTFDPAVGQDLATRFRIQGNPQVEDIWPRRQFWFEDEDLQRGSEDVLFTLADFVASDPRYAGYFADVPRDSWTDDMVPVGKYLELTDDKAEEKVPYVPMVDGNDVVHRLVVDDQLIRITRRCGQRWRSLQEQGGINNSHALALLECERAAWEEETAGKIAKLQAQPAPTGTTSEAAPVVDRTVADEPVDADEADAEVADETAVVQSDDPYIETPRCTTCDECTDKNNRMFIYDENKQAYVADPDAGTYRELVEAAEICQVCIIHPGKPRNPDEPGLDELVERAALFN
jgi:hypothetical protein